MFSHSTFEEKVLYQCYSNENFILQLKKDGEKKDKERASVRALLLIMSEELNYSDEQDIKTSDRKAMFWRPQYA